MLTSDMVRTLAGMGFDIGAHTVTHPILARLSSEQANDEIVRGKAELERITGREVSLFAYPNGVPGTDYRAEHVRMVREAGFAAAVTTSSGVATSASSAFELPRFTPWSRTALKFDVLMLRNLVAPAAHAMRESA
jgi:peptidoglycan/xylan/chitin deacetylase (PgdA/CDA1 family)